MKMDEWVGRTVRATVELRNRGGAVFPKGTTFTVYSHWRGRLNLDVPAQPGAHARSGFGSSIRHVNRRNVELVPDLRQSAGLKRLREKPCGHLGVVAHCNGCRSRKSP